MASSPTFMASDGLKVQREAIHAATLAVHAAAGFVSATHRQSARLLRAAEGLCRAAQATHNSIVPPSPSKPAASVPAGAAPPRRRRRGKRGSGREAAPNIGARAEVVQSPTPDVVACVSSEVEIEPSSLPVVSGVGVDVDLGLVTSSSSLSVATGNHLSAVVNPAEPVAVIGSSVHIRSGYYEGATGVLLGYGATKRLGCNL